MKYLIALLTLLFVSPAFACGWVIDHGKSHIRFSGTHTGEAFTGAFKKWDGTIIFHGNKPEESHARIAIDLASAETGNKTYDKTLPQADWLNSAKESDAVFETTAFRSLGSDAFEVEGNLTIRGVTLPVTLKATITIDGDVGTFKAATTVNRLAYNIGKQSDAKAEWISQDIPLDIVVVADRVKSDKKK